MDYRTQLLALAAEYARTTNRSVARVSTMVRNDGKFFRRLEEGRGCTVDTYDQCLTWFAGHWPQGAKWPREVPRPEARKATQ